MALFGRDRPASSPLCAESMQVLPLLTTATLALPLPWLFFLGWTPDPKAPQATGTQQQESQQTDPSTALPDSIPWFPENPEDNPKDVVAPTPSISVNPDAVPQDFPQPPHQLPTDPNPSSSAKSPIDSNHTSNPELVAADPRPYLDPNSLDSIDPTPSDSPSRPVPSTLSPQGYRLCPQPQPMTWQTQVALQLSQGLQWWHRFPQAIQSSLQDYSNQLLIYSQAAPWPEIHPQATQAKVPVIMYHDILDEKQVFFDVTTAELEADFELIRDHGLTPIAMDDLMLHLQTGMPLPEKPILLTFDDGYVGHYTEVMPLLEQFGYPALFSVFPAKVNGDIVGRSTLTWEQVEAMAASPWATIAAHSVTHPRNLTVLEDEALEIEVFESKRMLEEKLGIPIHYFTYPEGHYDDRVAELVTEAGYLAALTMDDWGEAMAGESDSLLAIDRFGQSRLESVVDRAWGGAPLPKPWQSLDFSSPVSEPQYVDIGYIPLILISGGRPITVHADSRYQVAEILDTTEAIAAVDGTFFSLEFLESNTLIGPVLSQSTGHFLPGNRGENPLLNDRPLVLISPTAVKFVPYRHDIHFTRESLEAELTGVTDAFVGAAWLVREGIPQPAENFGSLFDFDATRDRAFWGINQAGQPVIGVSRLPVDSVSLGKALALAGLQDAIMLDSCASTSLAYAGQSLMDYEPRPVPHIIGLVPPARTAQTPFPQVDRTCLPLTAQSP